MIKLCNLAITFGVGVEGLLSWHFFCPSKFTIIKIDVIDSTIINYKIHTTIMKKKLIYLGMLALTLTACDDLAKITETANDILMSPSTGLTNDEVIKGLKEALKKGTEKAVSKTATTNGFNNDPLIKIPFPQEAIKVKEKALQLGLSSQVQQFETTLNRAAEEASKEAKTIFVNAIMNMSIQDGFNILKGTDRAATDYLIKNTTASLKQKFSPVVQKAIDKVELTKYWNPLANKYNAAMTLTGGQQINQDLNAYVTQKAIDGLFVYIAKEEKNIRENPAARVTDILKKVFGAQ